MTKALSSRLYYLCVYYHIHIKNDSVCGDGSLILLFALILTFCQEQRGNMAGGVRIHGYRLEMAERLGGWGLVQRS